MSHLTAKVLDIVKILRFIVNETQKNYNIEINDTIQQLCTKTFSMIRANSNSQFFISQYLVSLRQKKIFNKFND
jgi:Cft2 family RNA processing exonuclease